MTPGADVGAFIAALPKAELHVHLLGSASLGTVVELARRHPERGVPTDPESLAEFYEFTDFAHFVEVYTAVNRLVTTGPDIEALVTGLAAGLARNNVRYAEVTVTPLAHLRAGVAPTELAEALESGRCAAMRAGVELAWIFDISGDDGLRGGLDTVDWVLCEQPPGTVGFGLGGPEAGVPRRLFREAFDRARAAGLHSVPHAGEGTGPEEVWSAVRDLGAERIGHGIGSVCDPVLLDHLSEHAITLEVCPTSNLRTRVVGSLSEHPLPDLLAAGVPVTLGTDDPGMFGTVMNDEYRLCHDHFALSKEDLINLVRQGITTAFCSPATRHAMLTELESISRLSLHGTRHLPVMPGGLPSDVEVLDDARPRRAHQQPGALELGGDATVE